MLLAAGHWEGVASDALAGMLVEMVLEAMGQLYWAELSRVSWSGHWWQGQWLEAWVGLLGWTEWGKSSWIRLGIQSKLHSSNDQAGKAASEVRQNDSWTVKKANKRMTQILLQKYAAKEFNYSHDLLKWAGKRPSSEWLFIEDAAHLLPIQLAREICGHRMWKLAATGWMEECL